MSWIVNILATLIYLGFGIIYAVDFFKEKAFSIFYCSDSGSNFSDTGRDVFIVSGGKLVWSMMWMSLGYVLMMLSLWVNVKMTMAVASYYAVWASCTWCLAYELSMVFCWLLRKRWEIPAEVFPIVLLLVGTAG